ncbi:MAG: hypothetical protein WDN49_03980 [Acetobacteraceae bacterium]
MTYKILYNERRGDDRRPADRRRPHGAGPSPGKSGPRGVGRIAVVADDPARLPAPSTLPPGVQRHERGALDAVQQDFAAYDGVSVIIYDQVCATEKRRRRKRGTMAAAEVKVSINPRVCENCGDCTVQSHCIAIEPIDTEYGRKRRISPTSCNTDLSCLKGFCPSFVTSATDAPRRDHTAHWQTLEAGLEAALPEPALPDLATPWRGLFAGIGGGGGGDHGRRRRDGGASGRPCGQHAGLHRAGAEEPGAVVSHVQIARDGLDVVRIPTGEATMMLAADLAVGAQAGVLEPVPPRRCRGREPGPAGEHRLLVRPRPGGGCRAAPPGDRPRGGRPMRRAICGRRRCPSSCSARRRR